jgi:hypothetical protein
MDFILLVGETFEHHSGCKYPEIFPSVFEKYERDPDKTFFWRDGMLK